MKNLQKKVIALILCVTLSFSAVSAVCFAADGGQTPEDPIPPHGSYDPSNTVLGWTLTEIAASAFSTAIRFGFNLLLEELFLPEDTTPEQLEYIKNKLDEITKKLDDISVNQEKTYTKLVELESFLTNEQYLDILNDYTRFTSSISFVNYCSDSLNRLTADTEEELARKQISLLTNEIGIRNYEEATATIDTKRSEYYNFITSPYFVQVDGSAVSRNLFGVYRELMRNNFCWENSAVTSINEFNNYVVTNYIHLTIMDILSIEARLKLIDEHNSDPANASDKWNKSLLTNLLENIIPAETAKVLQLYKEYSVDISDEYRHFWKGDCDIWFDSFALSSTWGNELSYFTPALFEHGALAVFSYDTGVNFSKTLSFTNGVFQKEYFRGVCDNGKPENTKLIDTATVNAMLSSCKNVITLKEIFGEANFENVGNIGNVLLNIDDASNSAGTYNSTINFQRTPTDYLKYKDVISYVRYIGTDTKNPVANDGAGKCEMFCYVDVTQRPDFADRANTIVLFCGAVKPAITDCSRLFVYENPGELETCTHTVMSEIRNEKHATCTEEGYTGDLFCFKCNKTVKYGEVIPKTHTPSENIINARPATCTEEGYTGDKLCVFCDEIAETGENIPKIPHEYRFNGEAYICKNCGTPKEPYTKACGDFTVSYYDDTADFGYQNGVLTVNTEAPIEIKNTNPANATTDTVRVADNINAYIILGGINIDVSGENELTPLMASDYGNADVTVVLKASADNILKAGRSCAAVEKNGTNGSLAITGNGSLYAVSGTNGSAIGSADETSTSHIFIKSGVITAVSNTTAIGCGRNGDCSDIVIYPTASVKADSFGCTPVNGNGEQVYLNEFVTYNQTVFVDGVKFPYTNHSGEEKVYIFLNGDEHSLLFPVNGKNGARADQKNKLIYVTSPLSNASDCIMTAPPVSCSFDDALPAGTGKTVSAYDSETDYGIYTFVLFGDVNGDGVCDVLDVADCERALNGHTVLNGVYFKAVDTDVNGVLEPADYSAVVNKALS